MMSANAQELDIDQLHGILEKTHEDPRIVVTGNMATPEIAVDLIDRTFETATINMLNAVRELPEREGITLETSFIGSAMRGKPTLKYVPARLSLVPPMFRNLVVPDIVILHTSLPVDGKVSLGIEVNVLPAAIESAQKAGRTVVAFVNPNMPYTYGDSEIELDLIDYLVEIEEPLLEASHHKDCVEADQIGSLIAHEIPDGATLQMGIGAIPDAVLGHLKSEKLRIWTETFSDGVLALDRQGILDQDHQLHSSFLIGSAELYDWADRNQRLKMLRTERTNDPGRIAENDMMISINAALQFDLHGQANASRIGNKVYSGFGGSTDFIVGAMHSPGGRSFMTLPSWYAKKSTSTIVGALDVPATSFQQSAVVTEQGIAWLFSFDEQTQADHIINYAAHPNARDELRAQAKKFWP